MNVAMYHQWHSVLYGIRITHDTRNPVLKSCSMGRCSMREDAPWGVAAWERMLHSLNLTAVTGIIRAAFDQHLPCWLLLLLLAAAGGCWLLLGAAAAAGRCCCCWLLLLAAAAAATDAAAGPATCWEFFQTGHCSSFPAPSSCDGMTPRLVYVLDMSFRFQLDFDCGKVSARLITTVYRLLKRQMLKRWQMLKCFNICRFNIGLFLRPSARIEFYWAMPKDCHYSTSSV